MRESPPESVSSQETWPLGDTLVPKKTVVKQKTEPDSHGANRVAPWKEWKKKLQLDELERLIVRLKQAETDMFQLKANEAKREAERLRSIVLTKMDEPEEEYASNYLRLEQRSSVFVKRVLVALI
ncbi:hypothetical protein Bca4012_059664 [Brassica carinata]|uniref:Oberon coiled-coil region domain-containing protein n=1 Tax=Brassica carinata TaxID=52824 RepID=A0A8X7V408_BRACI|nr:hypothetical protein Bca52824_030003 [Brassica carinata]